jgi:hypothetical protein
MPEAFESPGFQRFPCAGDQYVEVSMTSECKSSEIVIGFRPVQAELGRFL